MEKRRDYTWLIAIVGLAAGLLIGIWAGARFAPSLLGGVGYNDLSAEQQDDLVALVALGYGQTGDLDRAKSQLQTLEAPNLGQFVSGVAERRIGDAGRPEEISALAQLAVALGVVNPGLNSYLPTATPLPTPVPVSQAPADTPAPPSPTAVPVAPTAEATATSSPTPEQPTPTPQPAPAALAVAEVNVRSGPSVDYPVVSTLIPGDKLPITGVDPTGQWWQVVLAGGAEGWVLGSLVSTEGPVEGVPVIEAIAALPATPTRPAPANTPVRPTPVPPKPDPTQPAPGWAVDVRLRPVGKDAQSCAGGEHNIFVSVVDANGGPLNGQRVREIYTGITNVTGDQGKGDGRVEFDLYRDGGGVVQLVDEAGNAISPQTRGLSNTYPDFDMLLAAGYCNCKPHPDPASCEAELNARTYLFSFGHYVYDVVFKRNF